MSRQKLVVVIGATSSIGAAISQAFCDAGERVFLLGRNPRKVNAAAKRIPTEQLLGKGLVDLASTMEIASLVKQVRKQLTRIDILVLSAGEYGWTELGKADPASFDSQFSVNVRGPYLVIQSLLPLLEKANALVLIVNSSIVKRTGVGVAVFKATQHALQGLTDSLRQDLNQHGIRVSSLFLGQTATPRTRRIYAHRGTRYVPAALMRPREVAELAVVLSRLPGSLEVTDVHVRSVHCY